MTMENDNVEKVEVEAEANQIDPNLGFDKKEVKEKSMEERVVVEEPKPRFRISVNALSLLFSVAAIALNLFAQLFTTISITVYQVFAWLGTFSLFGALGIFVYEVVKNRKIEFSPAFILMLIACAINCFC